MQVISEPGGNALEGAFVRVSRLPLPVVGVPSMPLECGYTDIPPYDDQYSDANEGVQMSGSDSYSDDPYVDCPYDDYQDNAPEPD